MVPPKSEAINTLWKKLFDFVEHPLTLGALFLVGGIVGTILFTPALIICGFCVLLGFHRAKVVEGKPLKTQIIVYLVIAIVLSLGGYLLYGLLDSGLENIQTEFAKKIAKYVKEGESKGGAASAQPIKPFIVNVETAMVSEGPFFWRLNGEPNGQGSLLCPGRVIVYLSITNQKSISSMIAGFKVAMRKTDGRWEDLDWVEIGARSLLYMGADTRNLFAYEGNFIDLKFRNHNINPGETISGWAILDYRPNHVPQTLKSEFKFEIYDMTMSSSPDVSIALPVDLPQQEANLIVALADTQDLSKVKRANSCGEW
jgi:hypothetical protein